MGIDKPVTSLVTQVVVDRSDEAFANPTKPIGRFMDRDEAAEWERRGCRVIEDSGRGYRRVVPSPKPVDIVEIETIRSLLDGGQVVVACGGGGIPVVREGCRLRGVSAVIDKDFASARLAQMIGADYLVILTAVERVAVNYAKPTSGGCRGFPWRRPGRTSPRGSSRRAPCCRRWRLQWSSRHRCPGDGR